MDYARVLTDHLGVVHQVVHHIAMRTRMSAVDAADFRSIAVLHLMDDDYRVLRAFEARASLKTYLTVVLQRLWQDRCGRQWSRWRPSAEALRRGGVAIRLERLVQRDGLPLDEAIAVLQHSDGVNAVTLRQLWRQLPVRTRRQCVDAAILDGVADDVPSPSVSLEHRDGAARVSRALRAVLASLPATDRRLLRLRFVEGKSIADVARLQGLTQVQAYPTFARLLRTLRTAMEAHGVCATDAGFLIGADAFADR